MSWPLWKAYTLIALAICAALLGASPAHASTCDSAASPGTAPSSWQTYCWLDLADYNDTTARSAGGQNFSFTLSDGSILSFNLQTTSTAATGATSRAAPSWSGAAVGNSAFLGIPGEPILYMNNSGSTVTFTFSSIAVTPPPGVSTVSSYAFVVADGESTDNSEFLEYTTNGGAWEVLDAVPPISGSQMPPITGAGTSTFREDGGGQTGRVGAYIVGSDTPTTVTATMRGQGLQGIMFAVRFASISLSKTIGGARITANDQFDFGIDSTSSGTPFATGTTTGADLGPFPAVVLSAASGIPITLSESMAAGSDSSLAQYQSVLTCTNSSATSSTPMPSGVVTTSYNFGPLQFGDAVSCEFVNTPFPHVTFRKELGAGGRIFDTDQFRMRIRDRTAGLNVIQVDTVGTGSSFTVDTAGPVQVTSGNSIRVVEIAIGSTDLARYTEATECTNANASSTTALASGGRRVDFVPQMGDVITCVVTNTRDDATAIIEVEKSSVVISDPTGSANPKAIPMAIVEYTITVSNLGDAPVDADTLDMLDILPTDLELQTAFPVTFTEGATPSGLDPFNLATMFSYSAQAGGIAPYDYTLSGAFDGVVTGILIEPEGVMNASDGTNHPSFTITYRMRIE